MFFDLIKILGDKLLLVVAVVGNDYIPAVLQFDELCNLLNSVGMEVEKPKVVHDR